MRIAVTGASGFVGGAIATALADRDHEVVGFGREACGWSHPRAAYRSWDHTVGPLLGDREFDVVVHCAALGDEGASRSAAMRVNRDGTRMVVRTMRASRFVHVSTASVYDNTGPTSFVREDAPPGRHLSPHAESAAAAELELAGTDFVILRPRAVYGPGDPVLVPRLLGAVRRGVLTLPGGGDVLQTVTHIDNLVHAVVCALSPRAPSGVYNVGDDVPVVLADVVRALVAACGREDVRIRSVPVGAAFAAAEAAERWARLTRTRPRFTRFLVGQLAFEHTLDLTAARERLGYRPAPTSLEGAAEWGAARSSRTADAAREA